MSDIWCSFEKYGDHVYCKLCNKSFSSRSATTTLRYHINNVHGDETQVGDSGTVAKVLKRRRTEGNAVSFTRPSSNISASRIVEIDNAVSTFIWRDMRPLATVDGDGFRSLIQTLEPTYSLKHRDAYAAIVKIQHATASQKVKQLIAEADFVCFTTDVWTSIKNEPYITVASYFITSSWRMQSCVLATARMLESDNAEDMMIRLTEIADKYGIENDKICATVTGNGRNIGRVIRLLDGWPESKCFVDTLQLCLEVGFDIPAISRMRDAACRLVTFFKHSATATQALHEQQASAGIQPSEMASSDLPECDTKWNSTLDVLRWLTVFKWCIHSVLSDSSIVNQRDAKNAELSSDNWALCSQLVKLLRPFLKATAMMSSHTHPTASWTYPVLHILRTCLEPASDDLPAISTFKNVVLDQVVDTFYFCGWHTSLPVLASVLDPRYKALRFVPANSMRDEAYGIIRAECVSSNPPKRSPRGGDESNDDPFASLLGSTSTSRNVSDGKRQFNSYLSEPAPLSNCDPLKWWQHNAERLDWINPVARKYLCITASSVTSKSVFTTAGDEIQRKRSALLPENVDMLVFMSENADIIQGKNETRRRDDG